MTLRSILATVVIWLFFACNQTALSQVLLPKAADVHQLQTLNGKWKFKYVPGNDLGADSLFYKPDFDINKWADIKVPGNWEMQGFADPSYGKKLKEGTGLYRTGFNVPASWKNHPVFIAFDGIQFGYTVWINGKYAGQFASAFNRQTFDISAFVLPGKLNTLAVKVITHPKGWEFDTNDDWSISGISRSVTLFSLPPVHIQDVVIKSRLNGGSAIIDIKTFIGKTMPAKFPRKLKLTGRLFDQSGTLIKEFTVLPQTTLTDRAAITFVASVPIDKPELWSAENPYLYTLKLSLFDDANRLQQYTDHVGIREITWTSGVLKLNGAPIKLKGVTHHDLSPINGRAISEAEMKKDLKLMHQANINFIRTSHYPPNPRLLELCDSLGFYVMDEVPYGYGEEHLNDSTYLPLLLQRARLTVWRDKNQPCVIIWSVGNENPVTDIGLKTGRYVKELDGSRLYCFPQTPSVFENMLKSLPDSLDIIDDHYPRVSDLKRFAPVLDRPMVASEYAHALGLDFGSMEAIYETMYANPKMAGGAVWEFFDQGLLRKSAKPANKDEQTFYAWATRDSIYDTSTNEGMDGVVYANRVPQVDYWQVRKVYTPVKVVDDTLHYQPGKTTLKVKLLNRYDFTNLSAIKCKWQTFGDTTVLNSGILPLNCEPHNEVTAVINTIFPQKRLANYYYLKLTFEDKNGYQFYEKAYPLVSEKQQSVLNKIVSGVKVKPVRSNNNVVITDNYQFELSNKAGGVELKNKNGQILIEQGPYARVGRKPTIAQDATTTSRRSKIKNTLWDPFILSKADADVKTFNTHQLIIDYKYRPETPKERSLTGKVSYRFSDSGYVQVNYSFIPDGKEQATENGVSFVIPKSLTEFRWVGKGPYAAYPGKDRLSEFGVYHLNSNDLYFPGNREQVSLAIFSDAKGNGFALIADDANITVERTAAGIVVSHCSYVSGRFNKYEWPDDLYNMSDQRKISGSFKLVPFTDATTPEILKDLFGDLKKTAKAYQPFYHSYDQ